MQGNRLVLRDTLIEGGRITYRYDVQGEWGRFFCPGEPFAVEYDIPLEALPASIAVVPFLCNFLPVAWVCGGEILAEECDADFYRSIPQFKQGYIDMYPMLRFGGALTSRRLVENAARGEGSAAFFSGGVDAFFTLLSHFEEKPALITLWGADIALEDTDGWQRVLSHLKKTAEEYGLPYTVIKTAFRRVLRADLLSETVESSGDGWWHGFQHGIGIIGHAAPYLYLSGLSTVYIAASFCPGDVGRTGASYPTIDNHVRFCGCRVVHDGFEHNRQAKVRRICRFSSERRMPVPLRVCWESKGGGNCCACEKCARTLLAILAEKDDPAKYGFVWNKGVKRRVKRLLLGREELYHSRLEPIRQRLRETHTSPEERAEWIWLTDKSIEEMNNTLPKRIRKSGAYGMLRSLKRRLMG